MNLRDVVKLNGQAIRDLRKIGNLMDLVLINQP